MPWRFDARIADLGWHIEFLAHVETFDDVLTILAASHVPVVFGHLGYTHVRRGEHDTGFQRFLAAFEEGRSWAKLTGPYRISGLDRPPYTDMTDMAHALISANPSRLVWGSGWPHVRHKDVCRTMLYCSTSWLTGDAMSIFTSRSWSTFQLFSMGSQTHKRSCLRSLRLH